MPTRSSHDRMSAARCRAGHGRQAWLTLSVTVLTLDPLERPYVAEDQQGPDALAGGLQRTYRPGSGPSFHLLLPFIRSPWSVSLGVLVGDRRGLHRGPHQPPGFSRHAQRPAISQPTRDSPAVPRWLRVQT